MVREEMSYHHEDILYVASAVAFSIDIGWRRDRDNIDPWQTGTCLQ